jgi:hypothetical protein
MGLCDRLLQNIMTFNKCSIDGKSYGDIVDETTGEIASAEDVSPLRNLHL